MNFFEALTNMMNSQTCNLNAADASDMLQAYNLLMSARNAEANLEALKAQYPMMNAEEHAAPQAAMILSMWTAYTDFVDSLDVVAQAALTTLLEDTTQVA